PSLMSTSSLHDALPIYLVERDKYEGELANVVTREGLSCIPYFALASGFLTGKYRPGAKVNSQRAERAGAYLNEKGIKILAVVDRSEEHTSELQSRSDLV